MIEERYAFKNVSISHISPNFNEAYLEIFGINHLRPSYTAWIFFRKRLTKRISPSNKGFAGTLAVFGHSECWGGPGHCQTTGALRRFDTRPSSPMTRAFKRIPVAHALKEEIRKNRKSLDICIYTFSREPWSSQGEQKLLCCKGLQLVTI